MGNAYFYDYSFDGESYILDENLDLDFSPYFTSASPSVFAREGLVTIRFTGYGFSNAVHAPEIELYNEETNSTFPCEVKTYSYTEITCKMVKIENSLSSKDSSFTGFIKLNGDRYPIQNAPFESKDDFSPKITDIQPRSVSTGGEMLTITGENLEQLETTIGKVIII